MLFPQEEFLGKNGICYTLRSPNNEDARQMLDYLKTSAGETDYGLSYPEEMTFSIEEEESFIAHYSTDPGSLMISAFAGERLVGNANLSCVMDRQKTLHRATFGIAILRSEWGQGLGKKIVSELIQAAKQAGYEVLELEVSSANTPAINLYKQLGFSIYGERPRSLKRKDGSYYSELLMMLDLA